MSMTTARCLLLALALPAAALAQDPPPERTQEERLRELEERLAQAEERLRVLEACARREAPIGERFTDDRSLAPLQLVGPPAGPPAANPPTVVDGRPDVEAALRWLAKQADGDGAWRGEHVARERGVTGLVLLAFLGQGHTHRFGEHKQAVARGLAYLKREQERNRWLGAPTDPLAILDHTLATAALCEAYAISRDFTLRDRAQQAVDTLLLVRRPDGGFGFTRPRAASNTLCTAYGVLALRVARTAGLTVPDEALEGARRALSAALGDDGRAGLFAPGDGVSVAARDGGPPAPLLAAAAGVGLLYSGASPTDAPLAALLGRLAPPDEGLAEPTYWFLGGHAKLQAGGPEWEAWARAMLRCAYALQRDDGSFQVTGLWGTLGGAPASTAECVLATQHVLRRERARR